MNLPAIAAGPLANLGLNSGMQKLRQGFTVQATDSNIPAVVLTVIALCALVLGIDLIYRLSQRRPRTRRVDYLDRSTRVLDLSFRERHDLKTLARRAHLPHPAAMLLSPANLAYAVEQATQVQDNRALRQRMNRLSRRLFGVQLPQTPTG